MFSSSLRNLGAGSARCATRTLWAPCLPALDDVVPSPCARQFVFRSQPLRSFLELSSADTVGSFFLGRALEDVVITLF